MTWWSSGLPPNAGLTGDWSLGLGDPTVLGWTATLGYLATGLACWLSTRRPAALDRTGRWERRLWFLLALLFLGLGINKQLDLQTLITGIGKALARTQGWTDIRHEVQVVFVVIVGVVLAVVGGGLAALSLRLGWDARLAILGTGLVFAYVLLRAAEFNRVSAAHVGPVLELLGIAATLVAAIRHARGLRRPSMRK